MADAQKGRHAPACAACTLTMATTFLDCEFQNVIDQESLANATGDVSGLDAAKRHTKRYHVDMR
jgi:hypothetical protein